MTSNPLLEKEVAAFREQFVTTTPDGEFDIVAKAFGDNPQFWNRAAVELFLIQALTRMYEAGRSSLLKEMDEFVEVRGEDSFTEIRKHVSLPNQTQP